jgi:hypothetical protein
MRRSQQVSAKVQYRYQPGHRCRSLAESKTHDVTQEFFLPAPPDAGPMMAAAAQNQG